MNWKEFRMGLPLSSTRCLVKSDRWLSGLVANCASQVTYKCSECGARDRLRSRARMSAIQLHFWNPMPVLMRVTPAFGAHADESRPACRSACFTTTRFHSFAKYQFLRTCVLERMRMKPASLPSACFSTLTFTSASSPNTLLHVCRVIRGQ